MKRGSFAGAIAACAVAFAGCDDTAIIYLQPAANSDAPSVYGAGCSNDGALSPEQIAATGGALCERQSLVASLVPAERTTFPLRITQEQEVDFCFQDDDNEPHVAIISQNGAERAKLIAGKGCSRQRLPTGVYDVALRHAYPNAADADPDVIHTMFTESKPEAPAKLLFASNQCTNCNFAGTQWPRLDVVGTGEVRGFAGNYAGSNFAGSRCVGTTPTTFTSCYVGVSNGSNFDDANFEDVKFGGYSIRVQFGIHDGPGATFRRASFKNITYTPGILGVGWSMDFHGDFEGARFNNANFDVRSYSNFEGNLHGADFTGFRWTGMSFAKTTLGLSAYRSLHALTGRVGTTAPTIPVNIRGATVLIDAGEDFDNADLDGAVVKFVWPTNATTRNLALGGRSFRGATVRNVVFPCPAGGDLSQAHFENAVLDNVAVSNCNLRGANFTGTTFRNVTANNHASLSDTIMSGVTIDGLNVDDATLAPVGDFTLKAQTTATGLSAVKTLFKAKAVAFSAIGAKFNNAVLDGSSFAGARFTSPNFSFAHMDTVVFSNATFVEADFTSSQGGGVDLRGATFSGGAANKLENIGWNAAVLDGAIMAQVSLKGARFCGGSADGLVLTGANLTNALFPSQLNTYLFNGVTYARCGAMVGRVQDGAQALVTNAQTVCPDTVTGPCTLDARWTPPGLGTQCCTGLSCVRKVKGGSCVSGAVGPTVGDCACASLRCDQNICE